MKAYSSGKIQAAVLKVALQKKSREVSKSRPRIRVIHLIAPEIIKTDVANFRELVQRLTGNSQRTERRRFGKEFPSPLSPGQESKNDDIQVQPGGERTKQVERGGVGDFDSLIEELSEFSNLLPLCSSHFNIPWRDATYAC
ncbi:hypothetical protein NMG60_11029368 [Bertholletia excelsa]